MKRDRHEQSGTPFWIYGVNAIDAVLKKRPADVLRIVKIQSRTCDVKEDSMLRKAQVKPETADPFKFTDITGFKKETVHQGIAAYINPPVFYEVREVLKNPDGQKRLFLMLDGITDTGNLGAMIRTASACGVEAVIIPKDRSARIDGTIYKTSAGAIENVKICTEVNLSRAIQTLHDEFFMVYGLDEHASSSLYAEKFTTPGICCVVGGEDTGIRRLVKENCDKLLGIPMAEHAHSLNASVAAAVFMYEVFRQSR